jgi:hypothetical protein
MRRKSSQNGSLPNYRRLPGQQKSAATGTLPSFADNDRFASVVDVLMRRRIYLATWAGAEGAVVFIDILNGSDKRRYSCRDDAELRDVLAALHEEFCD